MKKEFILILIILNISYIGCSKKENFFSDKWRGEIKVENGVKVIENPIFPIHGELILKLEEDLFIGNEEDDNYMFYNAWIIAVDSQENILILDSGNKRIQKFNLKGKYLRTIGKKGIGPGEFSNPTNMSIDSRDNIYVYDSRRIKIFNENGQYQREIIFKNDISSFAINMQNEIFAMITQYTKSGKFNSFVKFDTEGKLLKIIEQFPITYQQVVKKSGERSIGFRIDHPYSISSYLSAWENKIFVGGQSLDNRLYVVDGDGDLIMRIEKKDSYLPITKKEKDRIKSGFKYLEKRWSKSVIEEAIQFPSHRPFFNGILIDNKGRIYLKKVKSVLDRTNEIKLDIFSKDGYYLYNTKLPISPNAIRNGLIYNFGYDKVSSQIRLKIFIIKNWNKIKKEKLVLKTGLKTARRITLDKF